MKPRGPVTVADIGRFDTLIDARSSGEFALDRIPGAVNCPVLDDEERRIVGTLYQQQGAFEARRVGGAMVATNLARHLREAFAARPAGWRPLVYCWRGGLRSGSMVQWLRLVGWDAQQLAGGYKQWRRHVIDTIAARTPALALVVLAGATGSAKTRVLHALAAAGAQTLDLEGMAAHRGSLLGALPGTPQPSQTHFETLLASRIAQLDPARPVFVEGESPRIGRINLPPVLVERMRAAPLVEIQAAPAARLAYLLRDYADLGADPGRLAGLMAFFKEVQGRETVERWAAWARAGALAPLFEELMRLHYDPLYARSQERHFARWSERRVVAAQALEAADYGELAGRVLAAIAGFAGVAGVAGVAGDLDETGGTPRGGDEAGVFQS